MNDITVNAEIRSVNNRFFEFSARLPKHLQTRENELKELVKTAVGRGKVNLSVTIERPNSNALPVNVNVDVARSYVSLLRELRDSSGLSGEITLETLMKFADVFSVEENGELAEHEWQAVLSSVGSAVAMLTEMRRNEGEALARDLHERIVVIAAAVKGIEELSHGRAEIERTRIRDRVAQILGEEKLDQDRLELEIVLMADKMDITEELVRFRSHLDFFRQSLEGESSEGRKIGFLLQEMNREANTIGAKANDAQIARHVVTLKEELERIREQIQNVE